MKRQGVVAAVAAAIMAAAMLVGIPALSAGGSAPVGQTVAAIKPPPIKPCMWMWFGNWRLCIRP